MEGDRVELTPEGFEKMLSGEFVFDDLEPEQILILRAIQSYEARELGGAPEDHLEKILEWGEQTLQQEAMLNMVLRGELYVIWKDDESDVCFSITPLGMERAGRSGLDISAMRMPDLDAE
jgi:hypothetical protein